MFVANRMQLSALHNLDWLSVNPSTMEDSFALILSISGTAEHMKLSACDVRLGVALITQLSIKSRAT